jgi:hypothetical protein
MSGIAGPGKENGKSERGQGKFSIILPPKKRAFAGIIKR